MIKKLIKIVLFCIITVFIVSFCSLKEIKLYTLPEGNLYWTKTYNKNVKVCIPAAFTSKSNTVEGEYILNEKIYNKNNKQKVSLVEDSFIIANDWKSNTGFQQIILVKNSKVAQFTDSRKFIRRALCKKENKTFILESTYPMTLSKFSKLCAIYVTDAVYLDCGNFGYGWIKYNNYTKYLFPWAFFTKNKQTNWLCIN